MFLKKLILLMLVIFFMVLASTFSFSGELSTEPDEVLLENYKAISAKDFQMVWLKLRKNG